MAFQKRRLAKKKKNKKAIKPKKTKKVKGVQAEETIKFTGISADVQQRRQEYELIMSLCRKQKVMLMRQC